MPLSSPWFNDPRKITYLNIAGAERPLKSPVPRDTVEAARRYRLGRIREQLVLNDCAAILLYDPINIRYATDVSNMQIWTMHNPSRYALIFADGPCLLFDYKGAEHLSKGFDLVDEVRPAIAWFYFSTGARTAEWARRWGDEIADLIRSHGGGNMRLAVDKCEPLGIERLQQLQVTVVEGQALTEQARAIKSPQELEMIGWTVRVCEAAMHRVHEKSLPGLSENEIWAELHHENIRNGGEWLETRLLASGPRTNPWFQECSDRVVEAGDMLAFDTDMVGPYGYCADLSRSWIVGHTAMSNVQADLYAQAREQIEHNMALLRPGLSFAEFNAHSWAIPERFLACRYPCAIHGVGLADEYPLVPLTPDFEANHYEGRFEENMTVCVESLIGEAGRGECVKLETQVVITPKGAVRLDSFPWEG
jgi:Xaa-Pro aminopeptidase